MVGKERALASPEEEVGLHLQTAMRRKLPRHARPFPSARYFFFFCGVYPAFFIFSPFFFSTLVRSFLISVSIFLFVPLSLKGQTRWCLSILLPHSHNIPIRLAAYSSLRLLPIFQQPPLLISLKRPLPQRRRARPASLAYVRGRMRKRKKKEKRKNESEKK